MKLAKKTLSVLLSVLMIISSISVCFSTIVFAESEYTDSDVKSLIADAVAAGANTQAKWKAAEAVYDYAVNVVTNDFGPTVGDKSTEEGHVGTDLLADNFIKYVLKLDVNSAAAEAQFVRSILNNGSGNLYYFEQPGASTVTANSSKYTKGISGGKSVGDTFTGDDGGHWKNWPNIPAVTKTTVVNRTANDYLMSIDSLDDIPENGFATTVTYTFTNGTDKIATVTKIVKNGGTFSINGYQYEARGTIWHYLASVARTESNFNTTAKTELANAKAKFDGIKNNSADNFLSSGNDLAALINMRDSAEAEYNSLVSKYTTDVIKKFVAAEIKEVLTNLNEAINRLYSAAKNMRNMLAYINNGFTPITTANVGEVKINDYNALYAAANAAYTAVAAIPDETIDSVKSATPDVVAFSKADSKAFLDELNESISLYNAVAHKATIDNVYAANNSTIADKYVSEDVISNEAVVALKKNIYSLVSAFNALTPTARTIVFGGTSYADLDELYSNISTLAAVRDAEVDYSGNYYQYFEPKFAENIGALKNAAITALYDEALEKKDAYDAAYAGYVASLGQDTVEAIFFNVNYGGEEMSMSQAAAAYIESLKANIIARNNAQLELLKEYSNIPYVDFNNITAVKNATSRFDEDLYSFVEAKDWLTEENLADYALADSVLQKVKDFVATGGLDFEELHHHDAYGVFTVRKAHSETDIARKDGEDYAVTEKKINDTISKLDTFITSNDFTSLVGLKNEETGVAYENLTEAIDAILNENLFSDKMVNTLIGTIYPLLTDTLGGLFTDLGSLGMDGFEQSNDPASSGKINIGALAPDTASGKLDLYLNGANGTDTLVKDLDGLGIKLYPQQIAAMPVMKNYPEIKAALETAGTRWKLITENEDYLDEEGNLNFVWGVTDYNSFINVVSIVFESIGPLLTALVSGKDYSGTLSDKAAYATSDELTINDIIGSFDLPIKNLQAYAKATLNLKGQNLFQTLWIPVMEALGVTDYTAAGFNFATVDKNSSYIDIANAMFSPLLEIIDQVSKQPIDKVLSIIPNLMYLLSMDKVQETLNNISIPLSLTLEITDIKRAEFGLNLSNIVNLFLGTINGLLPAIEPELILGDMLDLQDLIGFDLSNVNDVFDFVLSEVGIDAKLPVLNAGQFVLASHAEKNVASQRPGGVRNRLVADKADVLYLLLEYVLTAAGDSELIDAIIDYIAAEKAEKDPDAEPFELPEIVYTILSNLSGNAQNALAALIEIVNPQKYDTMDFDWYTSEFTYSSDVEDFDANSLPYLKYSNDWTKEKADYLINNIDEILETVLSMTGAEKTSLNELLQDAVASLFTNLNFTGVAQMLVKLGYMIDNDFVYELVAREFNLDLRTWAKTFGSSFPEILEQIKEENPDREIAETFPAEVPVIEGVSYADGVWTINGKEFADGDRDIFFDLFTTVCAPFAEIIAALFTGKDISLFNNAITVLGYDNYKNSIGVLFEILGMNQPALKDALGEYWGVRSQEQYAAMAPADAFNFLTKQLFSWLDYMFEGNTVAKIVELIPRFVYFFESNGIATVMHNMIMPILVILDVVRPIIDIDIDTILSTLVGDVLNSVSDSLAEGTKIDINIDLDRILSLLSGTGVSDLNPDHKAYTINLNSLKTSDIHRIVDTFLGTSLSTSPLVTYCVPGLCAGKKEITNSVIGTAYGSDVTASDTVTILVAALLETLQAPTYDEEGKATTNGAAICSFIEKILDNLEKPVDVNVTEIYNAVIDLIGGLNPQYANPNWGYMFSGNYELNNGSVELPEYTMDILKNYLSYENNWNEETAEALDKNLDELVDYILADVLKDNTLAGILNGVLSDNLYTDANLNAIVEILVNIFAGIDESLRNLLGTALSVNIAEWFDMCEIERKEDGSIASVKCIKDFGVDNAADKKAAFVNGIKSVLAPAERVVAWLFFGDDYKFFIGSQKDTAGNYIYNDILTIGGGKGYDFGLVPVLEALGCKVEAAETFFNAETGKYDVDAAIDSLINALLARVDEIAGKPAHEVLDLIPNLIYFINADGISTSVRNILASLQTLIDKVAPVIGNDNIEIADVLKDFVGLDITDLSMSAIIKLITDNTNIVIADYHQDLLENFYIGKITQFTSVNGEYAYKMEYTDEQSRADMITIVLSFAIDFVKENEEFLKETIGEQAYGSIMAVLSLTEAKEMQDFSWLYTEYADTDKTFTPVETSKKYHGTYNEIWTKDKAAYIAANLPDFIDSLLCLLGLEINGVQIKDLNALVENLIDGNLYTQANVDSILEMLRGVTAKIKQDSPYGNAIVDILKAAIGVDLTAWDRMNIKVTDGNREEFANALAQIVTPLAPLFKVLLIGEDLRFFYDKDGKDQILIPGSEGYAYGIIPVLEALGCKNVPTPDKFAGILKADSNAAIKAVINPVLDKLEDISTDPANKIFDMLPAIIYFIDSNGLDTSVKNILNSLDTVVAALEPIIGASDVMTLAGLDLKTYDFNWVMNFALGLAKDATGIDFTPLAMDAVAELIVGKVVSYKSANGETYYTMKYAGMTNKADMVTVVLRIFVDFLVSNGNVAKVEEALKEYVKNEQTYDICCSMIEYLADKAKQDPSMSGTLAVIYYIYYGLDKGVDGADSIYHNINGAWKAVLDQLDNSDNPVMTSVSEALKRILDKHLDGIFDSDGLASDGILTFWQKIVKFFEKILDLFKNMFK